MGIRIHVTRHNKAPMGFECSVRIVLKEEERDG